MKKRIFALVMILAIAVCSLASCKFFAQNKGDGENTGNSGVIYDTETAVNVVRPDSIGGLDYSEVTKQIYNMTGRLSTVSSDTITPSAHEIIFGDSSRELTKKAQAILAKAVRKGTIEFEDAGKDLATFGAFAIYSDGNSVAMVWNHGYVAEGAIAYFVENYINDTSLVLEDGYTYYEYFDYITLMEEQEEKKRDKYLDEIEEKYDAEVATAVDNLWSIYDDRYVLWLADLYDPGEYDEDGNPTGGGFYYSNSARDTVGYDIDLESTMQILSFLTSSGMIPSTKNSLKTYIPEQMQKELVAFAYSCQSSIDGAFYHPQWGMSISESRKSRDYGWGAEILGHFGYQPYWNTPGGTKGKYGAPLGYEVDIKDYIANLENTPESALTSPLTDRSTVTAVSKVVATADTGVWTGSDMFKDLDSWIKYLEAWESKIRTNSYGIGNTVSGLAGQAKEREDGARTRRARRCQQ